MKHAPIPLLAMLVACGVLSPAGRSAADSPPPCWTYQDFLDGKVPQTYAVAKGHPRLLITEELKPEIIAKAKAAPRLFQHAIDTAERGEGEEMVLACGAIWQLGLVPDFKYALTREQYGRKGVEGLMGLIGAKPPGGFYGPDYQLGLPCGYDWLYPLLSDEQKKTLVREMLTQAARPQAKYGDVMDGINGHIGGPRMTMGLACYGDGVDDEAARDIVEHAFRSVWWNPDTEQVFPAIGLQTLLYMEGGGWVEGISYLSCNFRTFAHVAAWKTATGQDYFARMGYFRSLPYWLTHALVPKEKAGQDYVLPLFNYHAEGLGAAYGIGQMMAAATGYLKDVDPAGASLARWWLDRSWFDGLDSPRIGRTLVYGLLIGDPRVKAASPAALDSPRTLAVAGMNLLYVRSRWDDPDATVLGFANNRFDCYRARGFNQFALWKNGGALFGYRGQIAGHYYFDPQAVPGNEVAFYQGTTRVPLPQAGAFSPATRTVLGSPHEVGTLASHCVPGQMAWIRGECGRRYRGKAVQRSERTLVYLWPTADGGPDHLVIRDRTRTDSADIVPHVVFQSVLEPRIGADWRRDDKGEPAVAGQWRIGQSPCVTITNDHTYTYPYPKRTYAAHARAFLRTLLPEAIDTLKLGGEEHPFDGLDGRPATKYLEGFQKLPLDSKLNLAGLWRLDIVPRAEATRHTFLHAIEATDSKVAAPGPLALLRGEGAIGAQAGANVVLFADGDGPLTSAAVKVAAETRRLVVGDLLVGASCTVQAGTKRVAAKASSAGTILVADLSLGEGQTIQVSVAKESP